tara:strand:- start:3251 stop:4009 length:759 start_codon:yes stop_codon:yes gene_type:complete
MLGLGKSILSPYVGGETPYTNTHSVRFPQSTTTDFFDTNTTLQTQLRGSFSISMWVKPDDGQSSFECFVGVNKGAQNAFNFFKGNNDTKLALIHFSNSGLALYQSNSANFTDGEMDYIHIGVVVTKNSGTLTSYKLYVNGSEVAGTLTSGITEANHSNYTNDLNLIIGASRFGSGLLDQNNPFKGNADEFAFFDDALTDAEMLAIGGGGAPTDITGHDHLHLYYKMNNSVTDEAGNSNGSLGAQAVFSTTIP